MGQNSSRSQPPLTHRNSTVHNDCGPSSTSNHPPAASGMEDPSDFPSSIEAEPPLPPGQPRRSIRKSLLSLVKPSSRPSTREASLASNTSNKRSWLNPRRWSRVPANLAEATGAHMHTTHNDGPLDISSTPMDRKGKGREECEAGDSQDGQFSSPPAGSEPSVSNSNIERVDPSPALPITNESSILPSQSPFAAQQENPFPQAHEEPSEKQDLPVDGGIGLVQDNHARASTDAVTPASAEESSNGNESPDGLSGTEAPSPPPVPAAARPLPPPGTLVVVQGVVHTTDVPRPIGLTTTNGINGDSVPGDHGRASPRWPILQERNSTDNRRISMPPRPRSSGAAFSTGEPHPTADTLLSNGQQATHGNLDANEATDGVSNAYHRDQTSGDVTSLSSNGVEPADHPTQPIAADEAAQNTVQQNGAGEQRSTNQLDSEDTGSPGSISSSSIDVLGTLLSVAAAATAASLLTGSSEPILPTNNSPGLVHSQGNSPNTAPTSHTTSPDFSAASRAERMRNAWSSIRERLGIRSSNSPDNPSSNNNTPPGSTAPAVPDTREMMLTEMARAFSVGLGLGGFTGPTANTNNNNVLSRSTERPATPEPRPPPAEGSFERFLVDLQADLRNALTTGEGGSGVRAMVAGVGWSDVNPRDSQSRQGVSTPRNGTENHSSEIDSQPETHNDGAAPASQAAGELEDESNATPPEETAPEPLRQRTGGNREERQPVEPSRINWWRLYRFPAIGVPRNNLAASVAAAAALSTGSLASPISRSGQGAEAAASAPVPENPLTHAPEARNASDSGNGNDATPQDNTVVPVIIVGLQSVHMDWRQGDAHPEADTNSTHNSDATGDLDEDIFGPISDQDDATEQSGGPFAGVQAANAEDNQRRGTRWRSRAADAFRNLRPRRGVDQRTGAVNGDGTAPHLVHQMPPMGPGSRMFLIYVIGGYYPPNHSIVLGNPADLESFEALSELAELLGQVKPSTATKDDIEKSGLQVIKAAQVKQHEREGKITSNCADRCLICLDDYIPEEDVRMMACRHAFHKDCVDKWLQTGKNNCPACRSRGVTTDARSSFIS